MRTVLSLCLLMGLSGVAAAQGNEVVQRSSSPSGLRISESGPVGASSWTTNSVAPAATELNAAPAQATQAAGKGTVQIQGNTAIKASAKNLNSTAAGRNSAAGNEVGAIGK